jgi:hypothetical protein
MTLYTTPITYEGEPLAILVTGTCTHPPPDSQAVGRIAEEYDLDAGELAAAAALIDPSRRVKPRSPLRPSAYGQDAPALVATCLARVLGRVSALLEALALPHGRAPTKK